MDGKCEINTESIMQLIENQTLSLVKENFSEDKINEAFKIQVSKTHIIPLKYRVYGGLLQSLNIKFGNFLEDFVKKLFDYNDNFTVLERININNNICQLHGGYRTDFIISERNYTLVTDYIGWCKDASRDKSELTNRFNRLIQQLKDNVIEERENPMLYPVKILSNDVDMLFFKNSNNDFFYVEMKKEDNHDSGKTEDIYKKILMTFACLLRTNAEKNEELICEINNLTPILMYFGDVVTTSNYFPSDKNIYSGRRFFDSFLCPVTFNTVDYCMCVTSNNKRVENAFYNAYQTIMNYSNEKICNCVNNVIADEIIAYEKTSVYTKANALLTTIQKRNKAKKIFTKSIINEINKLKIEIDITDENYNQIIDVLTYIITTNKVKYDNDTKAIRKKYNNILAVFSDCER